MELLQQSLALAAVFGLLGAAVWFIKRTQRPNLRIRGERQMQVVERISLTPQHTLCLVKIGARTVMIGTGPSTCQLMQSLEDSK